MGAAVFRTYFLVAQPPASREPVTMQVVARKAFIVSKPQLLLSNPETVVSKQRFINVVEAYRHSSGLAGM
jgi:hypothetical protein